MPRWRVAVRGGAKGLQNLLLFRRGSYSFDDARPAPALGTLSRQSHVRRRRASVDLGVTEATQPGGGRLRAPPRVCAPLVPWLRSTRLGGGPPPTVTSVTN